MELNELFEQKKSEVSFKRIVLSNVKDETGWDIESIEEFQAFLTNFKNKSVLIVAAIPGEEFDYFEILILSKAPIYAVCMVHPFLTNSYFKIIPDEILDVIFDSTDARYQFVKINYGNKLFDYVIEFPDTLPENVFLYLKNLAPKTLKKLSETTTLSIVFTNNDRFLGMPLQDITLLHMDVFRELLESKSNNALQITKQFWQDLKFLIKEK